MKKAMIPILTALLAVCAAVCFAVNAGADGDYVDLTDLTPENVKVGWGKLCVNTGLDGQSIDMTNKDGTTTVYEHGFTAHANSSLDFDISGMRGVKMFTAFIGAEHSSTNATPSATSISFLVYADGEKLYESGIFGINDPAEEIFVAIPAGTKILTLVTDDAGSNSGDHSAWGNPRLMTDASALEALSSIELSTDKNVYLACLVRLVLIPAVTVAVVKLTMGGYPEIAKTLLVVACAPIGSNVAVYAQKLNQDYTYAVKIVCITTILSLLTLPVVMLFV